MKASRLSHAKPVHDIFFESGLDKGPIIKGMHTNEYISELLRDLARFCDGSLAERLSSFALTYEEYCEDLPDINALIFTDSVANPVSSYEEFVYWDYNKNGSLNPDNVPYNANIKVFLKCPSGKTKHVNVSFVCCSGMRETFPLHEEEGICPLYGRPEICEDRCNCFNEKVLEFINRYLEGKASVKNFKNVRWLRKFALNDDVILSYLFDLYIKDKMSKSQFEELLLDRIGRTHLISPSFAVDIHSCDTLQLCMDSQKKYNFFYARIDPVRFDADNERRWMLSKHLEYVLSNIETDPYRRGSYLTEFFSISPQKRMMLSKEFKRMILDLIRMFPVQNLSNDIMAWLTE